MLNLAFSRHGTRTSDRGRWAAAAFIAGLGLAFSLACGPISSPDSPTSPSAPVPTRAPAAAPSPAPSTPTPDRVTVSGRFVVVFGDPPPDSGLPAQRRYSLTDQQRLQWTLTFDESVYTPPGGILAFNGKPGEVEGRRTEANRLLVESMRLP